MSLCKSYTSYHSVQSLPMSAIKPNNSKTVKHKEIPFCTCLKASMTIEAAVVIPLYVAFMVALIFFFRVLQVETEVAEALSYAGRNTAVECSSIDSKAVQLATAEALFRKELAEYPIASEYIARPGVTLLGSSFDGDYIRLCATYRVKLPIGFFGINGFSQSQQSEYRKWTGKNVGESLDDPYVYIAETGKVYHLTRSCPYLDLSIHKIRLDDVADSRNKGGRRYSPCSKCVKDIAGIEYVFITDYGTLYHLDLGCSRLKRTVYTVHLSEVGGKPPCSKCGGKMRE